MVQTQLGHGTARLTTWLPQDPRVRVGSVISLDKDPERWEVLNQFCTLDSANIMRGWRVGGLF